MPLIADLILKQMRQIGEPRTITSTTTSNQTAGQAGGGLGSLLGLLPMLYYMIRGNQPETTLAPTPLPASRDMSSVLANLPNLIQTGPSQSVAANALNTIISPTGTGTPRTFDEMIASLAPAAPKASMADLLGLIASLGSGGVPTDILSRIIGGRSV